MNPRPGILAVGALALLIIAVAPACHQSDVPLITPHPDEPCGNVGVPCYDGTPLVYTHQCCPETFICGGGFPNIGCPSGSCCFEDYGAPHNPDGTHHFSRVVQMTPDDS